MDPNTMYYQNTIWLILSPDSQNFPVAKLPDPQFRKNFLSWKVPVFGIWTSLLPYKTPQTAVLKCTLQLLPAVVGVNRNWPCSHRRNFTPTAGRNNVRNCSRFLAQCLIRCNLLRVTRPPRISKIFSWLFMPSLWHGQLLSHSILYCLIDPCNLI